MNKLVIFLFSLLLGMANGNAQNNAVFNGGQGDGWNASVFLQPSGNIFLGGNGDGWNGFAFNQAANAIFTGGIGDGWDSTAFAQPGNNIFFGGIGDGWSSTYRPMGPLPVNILTFSAQKKKEVQGLLLWQTSSEQNSAWFEIERSADAVYFESIGRKPAAGNSNSKLNYEFTDLFPLKGYNYYRLKLVDLDGSYAYSPARVLLFDQEQDGGLICFPNPSNGKFQVELKGFSKNQQLVININNAQGIVIHQIWLNPGFDNRLSVNLSGFPRGVYFIQAVSKDRTAAGKVILQ